MRQQRRKVTKEGILETLQFGQGLILFVLGPRNTKLIKTWRIMKKLKIPPNSVSFSQDETMNRLNQVKIRI